MPDIDGKLNTPTQQIPLGHPGLNEATPLYHWSPSPNRDSIRTHGLRIRSRSTENTWHPPFLALSSTPALAWSLSAMRTDYDNAHTNWDLWMTWTSMLAHLETIPFDDGEPREYRAYRSLRPDRIWYVGTRNTSD